MGLLHKPTTQSVYVPGGGGGSGTWPPATTKFQPFSVNLVAGQQSYAVTLNPAMSQVPTTILANVELASDSGDVMSVSVDWSTVTVNGFTCWLSGIPSASAGTIKGVAF